MASGCHFFTIPIPPLPPNRRCLRASQSPSLPASAFSLAAPSLPKTLSEIQKRCVIACLRAKDGMLAMEAARAALKGGIALLEVMMSTPDASMVIQGLLQENPFSIIGAGAVLNVDDAREAINAGAKFLMSPCTVMLHNCFFIQLQLSQTYPKLMLDHYRNADPPWRPQSEILHEVDGTGILYIPGVMTPTEVLCAYETGAKLVKVYPATILGGSKYIAALKRPFPNIPMVASQGISIDSIKQYIDAGTSAVVLSDAIFDKNAMKQKDFDTICRHAALAVSKVSQAEI